MNKKILILLVVMTFIPMFGCYTQIVTQETTIELPDSATVNITNNYDIEYAGYGYRYSGLDYYGGYQPYWYDNYYTPYYNPHRAYIYPFRPFAHRPIVIPHKPFWRLPFGKEPRKHFGTNWQIIKPTNPPKHGKEIGKPEGPRRESVRDALMRREASNSRFIPQRVQIPSSRAPQARESGQRSNYTPMNRGNERNYPISTPTHSQPQQTHSAPAPASNSGGNRSSGATRTGRER